MNHTPTPWAIDKEMTRNGAPIITASTCWMGNVRQIAKVLYHVGSEDPEVDANAKFIITACNAHDEVVAVLKAMVLTWDCYLSNPTGYPAYHRAKQVLAKVEK